MKTSFLKFDFAFIISAIILFTLPISGFAQGRGMRMPDSSQIAAQFDTLAMKVSLADSQKAKVRDIYFASFEETKKAFEKNTGDFRAMRETRMKIAEKRDNDIKTLLTDEQKKAYDKYIEEQRQQMRSRFGGRRPGN